MVRAIAVWRGLVKVVETREHVIVRVKVARLAA